MHEILAAAATPDPTMVNFIRWAGIFIVVVGVIGIVRRFRRDK